MSNQREETDPKKDLREGDFLCTKVRGEEAPKFGIFRKQYEGRRIGDGGGIVVDNYNRGFPEEVRVPIPGNSYSPMKREDYLTHLGLCLNAMEEKIQGKPGDLRAACWASRHHFLEGVIKNIEKGKSDLAPESPGTGEYVICRATSNDPQRNSLDPSFTELEYVGFELTTEPKNVAESIQERFGNRFRSIISNFGVPSDDGTPLKKYFFAYEIPEKGLVFIGEEK